MMVPLSGMLVGTALGVIAEIAGQSAYSTPISPGKRIAIAAGFGLAAGISLAYVLNASDEQRQVTKGQLTK